MNFVLPALQATLAHGTTITGQSLESLIAQK